MTTGNLATPCAKATNASAALCRRLLRSSPVPARASSCSPRCAWNWPRRRSRRGALPLRTDADGRRRPRCLAPCAASTTRSTNGWPSCSRWICAANRGSRKRARTLAPGAPPPAREEGSSSSFPGRSSARPRSCATPLATGATYAEDAAQANRRMRMRPRPAASVPASGHGLPVPAVAAVPSPGSPASRLPRRAPRGIRPGGSSVPRTCPPVSISSAGRRTAAIARSAAPRRSLDSAAFSFSCASAAFTCSTASSSAVMGGSWVGGATVPPDLSTARTRAARTDRGSVGFSPCRRLVTASPFTRSRVFRWQCGVDRRRAAAIARGWGNAPAACTPSSTATP